ncbi:putative membrane protein [Kutzneria albida DSM 43870]|uniref:Putative membrane protein n=2 Tax=Kutzneria TaxID=43356 RepID=W5WG93_9PSEU|nr:putative membrane protein [Kutzneria albida DSM 43870]
MGSRSKQPRRITMLATFVEWLEDYTRSEGVTGLVQGVLGVLGFGGLLSVLFGDSGIRAGILVGAMLGVLGLMAILFARQSRMGRELELMRKTVRRCYSMLDRHTLPDWRITSWRHVIRVQQNGDTIETISLTGIVEGDQVESFVFWSGAGWHWPRRHQRRFQVTARTAMRGDQGGTRPDLVHFWISDNAVASAIHLPRSLRHGDEASFDISVFWPAKCLPLARGGSVEEFARSFANPLPNLRYSVVLPAGLAVCYEAIGLEPGGVEHELATGIDDDGRVVVTLAARDVPAGHRVGMRLDPAPEPTRARAIPGSC